MKHPANHPQPNRQGVALVIVLACLVIIFGLAVLFLNRAKIERSASASYAANTSTRHLADMAVNLVQGTIHNATSQPNNPAWTSQPGMIRNYEATSSTPSKVFKLYSAETMIVETPSSGALTDDLPPATWASNASLWTDLNAPVNSVYPILDPAAQGSVEGFDITGAPVGGGNNAPMPVKWLYVLEDGTMVAPTVGGSSSGQQVTVSGANATDKKIVGRIAFWTDDETCKLNINTSSDGTFWDVPRVNTAQDRLLAKNQPAQREYQRYPGHPAMTSLAPVFFATSATSTPDLNATQKEELYQITPRVVGGGSESGTKVAGSALTPDSDRLYASLDELIYDPGRSEQTAAGLTSAKLEQSRFFLTASSRAPEVTLFNTPRVAMWPISATTAATHRTAFDRLIAHCATINGHPYYFQRSDSSSATADFPGVPASSPLLAGVGRNRNLYAYLQDLTSRPFPGFGSGTLAGKYGADRDQILTEMFDYVRATNTEDSGLADANRYGYKYGLNQDEGANQVVPIRIGSTQGFGRFPVLTEIGLQFIATAQADDPATPGVDESKGSNVAANKTLGGPLLTAGQRRVEAVLLYEQFVPGQGWPKFYPAYTIRVRGLEGFAIGGQNLNFPDDASNMNGNYPGSLPEGRGWGGILSPRAAIHYDSRAVRKAGSPIPSDGGGWARQQYRFVSWPVTVNDAAGTMSFTGGDLTVEVYPRTSASYPGFTGAPVYTFTITIPDGTFPLPHLSSDPKDWTVTRSGVGSPIATVGRFNNQVYSGAGPADVFKSGDVVRTVVAGTADYRLLAARATLDPSDPQTFKKHPDYDNTSVMLAHSFTEGKGFVLNGATELGPLVGGVTYDPNKNPDVLAYDASMATGDWDNGVSITVDGAYVNKPDEGNSFNIASNGIPYFESSHQWENLGQAMFSPNRQVPSAGMFGSLSSGVKAGVSFRTLLFRPQAPHFGASSPPDHLWADLFWMPAVEPYAISEPFSTSGKINMNYQIFPFSYIKRSTALAGLLRAEKVLAIPTSLGPTYKTEGGGIGTELRKPINIPETLSQFDTKFANGEVFKSSSEICELHLVPQGTSLSGMNSFWGTHALTGDNSRERPYTNILGRLTTKSNTFTVHYKVQSLKKRPDPATVDVWDESRDVVTGEYRGSTTIERYINPNDSSIPDYASNVSEITTNPASKYYKWRVVNTRRFAP